MTRMFRIAGGATLALMSLGCDATLGAFGGGSATGSDTTGVAGGTTPDAPETSGAIGGFDEEGNWVAKAFKPLQVYSPVSRLTQTQYKTNVRQAFGVDFDAPELPADEHTGLKREANIPPLGDYDVYVGAAISVGQQLAETYTGACDFASDPVGCTEAHLGPALRTLYRGVVTQADIDSLSAVISEAVTRTDDVSNAVSHGIARTLLEPQFLYRLESGSGTPNADGGLPVTPHELASRLSFVAWEGPPDGQLLDLADAGTLSTPVILQEQAARALQERAARDMIWNFIRLWLRLPDENTVSDPLDLAKLEETRRFIEYVLVDEEAPFTDLLTANYSFLNAELAEFYGVPAPANDWDMVVFPEGTKRNGVLTHASFLAANSAHARDVSWIFRGKIVFEHMFCGVMPSPPDGVAGIEVDDRTTADGCKGCHSRVDPMGIFFDQFDEYGALMANVPTPGVVDLGSDIDADYADVKDFLLAVSTSAAFEHCFVKLWFQHALGRELAAVDQASFDAALEVLRTTGSLRQMIEAIVTTPAFSTLYPKPEEMICQ